MCIAGRTTLKAQLRKLWLSQQLGNKFFFLSVFWYCGKIVCKICASLLVVVLSLGCLSKLWDQGKDMISSLGYCACRSEYLHPESRIPNPLETAMGLDLAVFTLGHVQYREHFVPGWLSAAWLAIVGMRGALLPEIWNFGSMRTCVRHPIRILSASIGPPRPSVYPRCGSPNNMTEIPTDQTHNLCTSSPWFYYPSSRKEIMSS